jgi:hypothetical protein
VGELFPISNFYNTFGDYDIDIKDVISNKLWEHVMHYEEPERNELCVMYKQAHSRKYVPTY